MSVEIEPATAPGLRELLILSDELSTCMEKSL